MPDNPELDRYWAGQIDQKLKGLADQFERERNERIAQFTEDRKERSTTTKGCATSSRRRPRLCAP
jgi:hypothetical protein